MLPLGFNTYYRPITEQDTDIESQMTAAHYNLLRAVVRNERHVLRRLFPSEKPRIYDLRPRAHNFKPKWHRRHADKVSAAARRLSKIGGGAYKLTAVARPAQGSMLGYCIETYRQEGIL